MKRPYFSITMGIIIALMMNTSAISKSRNILIIESYHSKYEWDKSYIHGIKEVMKGNFRFYTFQMNTKRIPESEYERSAQKAWDYYIKKKPDLVFLGDDNALNYLGTRFAKVQTPVVFLGINNNPRAYHILSANNITGVLERPLLKRSIAEMKKLLDMKKILVLFDSGTTSKVIFNEIFYRKEAMDIGGISVHIKLIGSWDRWKKVVLEAGKQGYDAMVIGLYQTIVNKNNIHIDAEKVINWTSENTLVPPFAFWDFAVGPGKAIGGLTLSGETQGQEAARMAMEILNGTPPNKIAIRYGKRGELLFSRSQLKKYGLKLPEKLFEKATLIP